MATAKPLKVGAGRRGWRGRVLLGLLVVVAVLLAAGWTTLSERARLAAAYGARVGCSCRFVGGRALGDCRKDFEPGMGPVWLSEDAASKTVTAHYPLLSSQSASYREGEGCVLEKWQG